MKTASWRANVLLLLALWIFPFFLHATHILKNDLLKIEAVQLIENIGKELEEKTAIHSYILATNEHFPQGFNLVAYTHQYEANLIQPYVIYIFAPYAVITKQSEARGRVGIIPSSSSVRALYDYEEVRDAGIDIIAMKDSNSEEDKFNIGMLQAYSVLADNIAHAKGIVLEKTIKDEMGIIILILRILVYSGTAILVWIFILRPLWLRRKNAKR